MNFRVRILDLQWVTLVHWLADEWDYTQIQRFHGEQRHPDKLTFLYYIQPLQHQQLLLLGQVLVQPMRLLLNIMQLEPTETPSHLFLLQKTLL